MGHGTAARCLPSIIRQIALREYLRLTMSFDHEIVDGALAARATRWLKAQIESGYGVGDAMVESRQARADGAAKQQAGATQNALP